MNTYTIGSLMEILKPAVTSVLPNTTFTIDMETGEFVNVFYDVDGLQFLISYLPHFEPDTTEEYKCVIRTFKPQDIGKRELILFAEANGSKDTPVVLTEEGKRYQARIQTEINRINTRIENSETQDLLLVPDVIKRLESTDLHMISFHHSFYNKSHSVFEMRHQIDGNPVDIGYVFHSFPSSDLINIRIGNEKLAKEAKKAAVIFMKSLRQQLKLVYKEYDWELTNAFGERVCN